MRKFHHIQVFKISAAQIESVERQYWAKYNNDTLESSLRYKLNTNTIG